MEEVGAVEAKSASRYHAAGGVEEELAKLEAYKAKAPVTCGVAMEVPEKLAY
jgi:hypothetical protein